VIRIGVISDTHGLLRPKAKAQLAGSHFIVHGGDIGSQAILDELHAIAPLTAVRGNNDRQPWAASVPDTAVLDIGGMKIYTIHDIGTMTIDPAAEGYDVVVYGHSHKPLAERRDGVLYLNPGSAGPRRFKLPVSVARLDLALERGEVSARIIELAI